MSKLVQQQAEWIRVNGMPVEELAQRVSRFRKTRPEMVGFAPLALPDNILRGGEVIPAGSFNFRVLWTPGHSPGHICLYEPAQEILISGEHILPDVTTDISLEPNSRPNPLDDYLNSLNEISQLKVSLVLPGHGQPFTNLGQRIDEISQNLRQRSAEILETVKSGAKTCYQVASEITWVRNGNVVGIQDMGPWEGRLALLKTLAHLESMKFDGQVQKYTEGGYHILPGCLTRFGYNSEEV